MIYRGIFIKGLLSLIKEKTDFGDVGDGVLMLGFALLVIAAAYLIGSLNFAVIISKLKYGQDIRDYGSGNGGSTNMLRTYGKKMGAVTLLCDMLKAAVACTVGCLFLGLTVGGYLAAFFCMLGHMFPVYYKFKGGKGVAVSAAAMLMLNPTVFAVIFVCFVIIVGGTKYVSLGSVMCALLYPVILNTVNNEILYPYLIALGVTKFGPDVLFAVLMAIFVVVMHRENIKRLIAGNESKVSFGKKSAQEDKKNDKR